MAKKKNLKKNKANKKKTSAAQAAKQQQQPKPKQLTFAEQVNSFGTQLATYKVQHVWPAADRLHSSINFFGVGGSAISADLVNNYLRHLGIVDLLNVRKDFYRQSDGINTLPSIFSSYSGMTAETVTQAHYYSGRTAVAITTGGDLEKIAESRKWGLVRLPKGYQPRAALGYSFSTLLSLIMNHEAVKPLTDKISADLNRGGLHIRELIQQNRFDIRSTNIADKLYGKSVAVYSSEMISGINYRWRGQLQENADNLAFGGFFPEMTHNHVNGFTKPDGLAERLAVVILKWKADHVLVQEKQTKMAAMLRENGFTVLEISTEQQPLVAAMMELVYLADCVSMKLAEKNTVEPEKIDTIQKLKK
jgi:glucose/mannose-6-phosphate isomerase